MNLDLVTNYIRESKHLVCLVGNKLQEECGVPRLRVQAVSYTHLKISIPPPS